MGDERGLSLYKYYLTPGYVYIARAPTTISTVLGSAVSVCIHDKRKKIGGMNHFLYPSILEKGRTTPVYGNVATIALIRLMLEEGCKIEHLVAQILGGAHNYEISKEKNIGHENVQIARRVLMKNGIKVLSEDVGGSVGRKVVYDTWSNEVVVLKVERIRDSDWYPYEGTR